MNAPRRVVGPLGPVDDVLAERIAQAEDLPEPVVRPRPRVGWDLFWLGFFGGVVFVLLLVLGGVS